ncbi:MAG: 50S ribosomal protein L24 [Rhodoluna sp.]|jgi:large subunit ribosomal protein L24|nr:50S ribosomal protein L24 [Rhodoluna sp.]
MANIKKGDTVVLLTGKRDERGKTGTVLSVNRETNRVIVEGLNKVTKHTKVGETDRGGKTGGIETIEASIHISNVALVDPSSKKPTRLGAKVETVTKNGVKKTVRTRIAKRSGKEI